MPDAAEDCPRIEMWIPVERYINKTRDELSVLPIYCLLYFMTRAAAVHHILQRTLLDLIAPAVPVRQIAGRMLAFGAAS